MLGGRLAGTGGGVVFATGGALGGSGEEIVTAGVGGVLGAGGAGFATGGGGTARAASFAASAFSAAARASRSRSISALLFTITPSGMTGPLAFGASTSLLLSGALGSTASFEPNSSTSDSAEILSTVLEALLTSYPRSRRSSINSLLSIPICLESWCMRTLIN